MTHRFTAAKAAICASALLVLAACGSGGSSGGGGRQQRGGQARARREPDLRGRPGRAVDEQHDRVRQQLDLDLRADLPAAVHGHQQRQGRAALAGHQLQDVGGQEDLHVHAPQGREVLQRQADDLGRREVLDRPEPQGHAGLGLPGLGDQFGRCAEPRHRRDPPEVPVGAAARGPVDLRQRHRAEQLRRPDRGAVLPAPDRHRAVQVGLLAQGPGPQAGAQYPLLAAGQALPEQRHLDRRPERQHQGTAAQGRPGPDRPDPGLVHGVGR